MITKISKGQEIRSLPVLLDMSNGLWGQSDGCSHILFLASSGEQDAGHRKQSVEWRLHRGPCVYRHVGGIGNQKAWMSEARRLRDHLR